MESDGSIQDTRIYTSLGRGGVLNPTPVGVAALVVFICLVTGAIAPG
jgi:hypothetical protein